MTARDATPGRTRPIRVRLPLVPIGSVTVEPPAECPICGSRAFNLHQHVTKAVDDPSTTSVDVARYRCKRCGYVARSAPPGVGPGRASLAVRQLVVLLRCAGLSYRQIATVVAGLGYHASASGARRIVIQAGPGIDGAFEPLDVTPAGAGLLAGHDVSMRLSFTRSSGVRRWLVVEVSGTDAADVAGRLVRCGSAAFEAVSRDF